MNIFEQAAHNKNVADQPVPWHKNKEARYVLSIADIKDTIRSCPIDALSKLNQQNNMLIVMMRTMHQYIYAASRTAKRLDVLILDKSLMLDDQSLEQDLATMTLLLSDMTSIRDEYQEL